LERRVDNDRHAGENGDVMMCLERPSADVQDEGPSPSTRGRATEGEEGLSQSSRGQHQGASPRTGRHHHHHRRRGRRHRRRDAEERSGTSNSPVTDPSKCPRITFSDAEHSGTSGRDEVHRPSSVECTSGSGDEGGSRGPSGETVINAGQSSDVETLRLESQLDKTTSTTSLVPHSTGMTLRPNPFWDILTL